MKIKKTTVRSIHSEPLIDNRWKKFIKFINKNSTDIDIRMYESSDFNEEHEHEVGGASESILISIILNVAYDVGKNLIKKLLKSLKRPAQMQSYKEIKGVYVDELLEFAGHATIQLQFIDNKEIEINIPFPSENNNIDTIDLNILDNILLYNSKAKI